MTRTGFYMHPAAVLHDTGWGHPEHQGRLRALASALRADIVALHDRVEQVAGEAGGAGAVGVGSGVVVRGGGTAGDGGEAADGPEGSEAVLGAIGRVHRGALIDAVRRAAASARERGRIVSLDGDTKVSGASWEAALGSSEAGLNAVRAVAGGRFRNAFVAARPPGHHATPDRAMGFCLFNHIAVAAAALRAEGLADRVLIVDWDVHHGNGTQDAFYDDDSVFFLSLHQHPHYPGTGTANETGRGRGEGFTLNVPLARGTSREDYLAVFDHALRSATDRLAPDFVLVSGGFDVLAGDPLGGQLLEPEDLHRLTRTVMAAADRRCDGRVVVFLEGGYDPARTGAGAVAVIRALAGVTMDGQG